MFASAVYVVFAQFLVASMLLSPPLIWVSLFLYVLVLVSVRRVPLALVLRRSGADRDYALIRKALGMISFRARILWLTDPRYIHQLTKRRRTTVLAWIQLMGTPINIGIIYWMVPEPLLPRWLALVLMMIGTWVVVESMAGNGPLGCITFLAASAMLRSSYELYTAVTLGWMIVNAGIGLCVVALITWMLSWIFPSLAGVERRTRVASKRELIRLLRECDANVRLFPRYVLNAPALLHEITADASTKINGIDTWKFVVVALLSKVRVVVIDVTDLEGGPGLRWELKTCLYVRAPIVLVGDPEKDAEAVERVSGRVLPICKYEDIQHAIHAALSS